MRSKMVKGVLGTVLGAGVAAGAFLAFPALGQDMLPDGPGKAETTAACSGCHGLGQIVGEHRDAATWATTVTSMINNGAPVADADFDKIVNYLATNFGTGPAPAAAPAPAAPAAPAPAAPAAAAPGPAASAGGLPDGPGMAEVTAACSGCHGLGQILNEHRDAATWATTVTSMINNGAPVADADFDKIVNYLATNFGTGPAPAPAAPGAAPAPAAPAPAAPAPAAPGAATAAPTDNTGLPDGPGKAETVAACSGCHGLGQILNEHRDAATWGTTVTSMINNGAPVADADFDKIVAYLAAHFGP